MQSIEQVQTGRRTAVAQVRPFQSLRYDPRFSFCAYVPQGFSAAPDRFRLLMGIHGSGRDARELATALTQLADASRYIVLAPLFPIGIVGDRNGDGYKYLTEPGIDYSAIIEAVVAEFEGQVGRKFPRFSLFGMSGGAQCALRFSLVRPERIEAASIAAPGTITLPGDGRDWWLGTGDVQERFGRPLDREALRRVRFQLLVGALDLDVSEILPQRSSAYAVPGPIWGVQPV